jgi:hypothetical protein
LVRSLHGHHYWPFYYGDGPLEEQSANAPRLRHATILRACTDAKFTTSDIAKMTTKFSTKFSILKYAYAYAILL